MFTTLITETSAGRGFPVQGLITLLVAAVIFYPVQKKVREAASRRRRERWEQEGLLTQEEQRGADGKDGVEPATDPGSPTDPPYQAPTDTRPA